MPTKISPIGITTTGNHPLNKQSYVELSLEDEEIFKEVEKEMEAEKGTNVTRGKDLVKDLLNSEKREQEVENYKENEINWIDDKFWIDAGWDGLKGKMKKSWKHKQEYSKEDKTKWFFLAHSGDIIKGKPQLVFQTMQKIPLVRLATAREDEVEKDSEGNVLKNDKGKPKKTGNEVEIKSYYFFDEKFDKRHDGFQQDAFSLDFWMYKIVTQEGKEVFIWTQKQLPNCSCNFTGMMVELEDMAELSRNMKVKSIGRVFFMKDFVPDVKILSPEKIVEYTKNKDIQELDWDLFLNYHPNGNINIFDDEVQSLRSSVILSGKRDGYGLHIAPMGKAGTKKSMGWLETLDYKFSEHSNIIGGGNSRAKALTPSFKEKPADIGYFAKVERMGFVDEIGKMAEMEMNKHQTNIKNLFGEWTDLLDCKRRTVGSGNNNSCEVEPTAKHIFPTNPVSNSPTIHSHVGIFDAPMMSRILWWVQDNQEVAFLRSSNSVLRISPHTLIRPYEQGESPPHTYARILEKITDIENRKKDIVLYKCWGKISSREEFLTFFDSCNAFTCNVDENEVERLKVKTLKIACEPMASDVWKPRADHHIYLLVDGLVKHRCLFKDYDPTFTPKQEDYDLAEKILLRMVRAWDSDLSTKKEGLD